MDKKNQDTRTESEILNEMLQPIMHYCLENSIPSLFVAKTPNTIVKATMGNNETTAYLLVAKLDGDYDLQDEFEKQLQQILDEDE